MFRSVTIRHWLPIVTVCPVNHLPDLVYASVTFDGHGLNELYAVRKRIRKTISWRKAYMEDLAAALAIEFPDAAEISVRLAFNRHVVKLENDII